jgi:hypothetical protein
METKHTINWQQMFRVMYSGVAFDVTARAWNRKTQKGGKRKKYIGCFLQFTGKPNSEVEVKDRPYYIPTGNPKSPNHPMNGTLNILMKNADINTIHLPLIEFFNRKKVIP